MINWTQGFLILAMGMWFSLYNYSQNKNTQQKCEGVILSQSCTNISCEVEASCKDKRITFQHNLGELTSPLLIEFSAKDNKYCLLYLKDAKIIQKAYDQNNCHLINYEN